MNSSVSPNLPTDANDRYVVVSTDGHAGPEAMTDYRPYLDPEFREDFDRWAAEYNDVFFTRLLSGEKIDSAIEDDSAHPLLTRLLRIFAGTFNMDEDLVRQMIKTKYGREIDLTSCWDADARLEVMEGDGIAAELIFSDGVVGREVPFQISNLPGGKDVDPRLRWAGKRAFNRWLADFCSVHPGRFAGWIRLSYHDVDSAVAEIRRCREAGLFGGVELPPLMASSGLPGMNDPYYEPIWAVCEELDLPLNTHNGEEGPPEQTLYGSDPQQIMNLVAFELFRNGRRPLWFLIVGGVFDRHPNLRLIFTEALADWVAPLLRELDCQFTKYFWGVGPYQAELKPSEYWMRNCFVAGSFLSRYEAESACEAGLSSTFMWGADHPHPEGTGPFTMQALQHTFGGLPGHEVRSMLGENALRAYGFDHEHLREVAARIGPTVNDLSRPLPESAIPELSLSPAFVA